MYNSRRYLTERRLNSIIEQFLSVSSLPDVGSLIEIGVGSGLLGYLLRNGDFYYRSLDISLTLKPDVVGDVCNLPFESGSFDAVACFQVLEHLEFEQSVKAIEEMYRVAKKYLILSLPIKGIYWTYSIYIPTVGLKKFVIKRPFQRMKSHIFDGEHLWELGSKQVLLNDFIDYLHSNYGGVRHWHCHGNPYHYFIVIQKS